LLTRQARALLDQNKPFDAIELYKKSANYLEAAKILYGVKMNFYDYRKAETSNFRLLKLTAKKIVRC